MEDSVKFNEAIDFLRQRLALRDGAWLKLLQEADQAARDRSALTFRVMTAQAMAAGRWRQIQRLKARRPWLRYITAGDHRVRDAHKAWHGIILHADDPWWHMHFPPNGFNCRCHVQQLSDPDLERYGLTETPEPLPLNNVVKFIRDKTGAPVPVEVPAGVDPGFAVNFGAVGIGGSHGQATQLSSSDSHRSALILLVDKARSNKTLS